MAHAVWAFYRVRHDLRRGHITGRATLIGYTNHWLVDRSCSQNAPKHIKLTHTSVIPSQLQYSTAQDPIVFPFHTSGNYRGMEPLLSFPYLWELQMQRLLLFLDRLPSMKNNSLLLMRQKKSDKMAAWVALLNAGHAEIGMWLFRTNNEKIEKKKKTGKWYPKLDCAIFAGKSVSQDTAHNDSHALRLWQEQSSLFSNSRPVSAVLVTRMVEGDMTPCAFRN